MRTAIDTSPASAWLETRRQVQQMAEVVLGDAADYFLYRGRLFGGAAPCRHISALLASTQGCELVLQLLERLDAGESLEATILDDNGSEPDGPGRPVLTLIVGHLCHLWANGHREPV